jgi:hypothetical protein
MGNSRIMVVVGEHQWTLGAIHLACAVARSNGSEVVLLHMVPVRRTWFLGTDLGLVDFTLEDQRGLTEYAQIPASYGVCFSVCVFQYDAYVSGLLNAAEQLDTLIVFAVPPRGFFALWHEIKVRWLKRALSNRHRSLYTLEQPDDAVKWTPLITLAPETAPALPAKQTEPPAASQLPLPTAHYRPE